MSKANDVAHDLKAARRSVDFSLEALQRIHCLDDRGDRMAYLSEAGTLVLDRVHLSEMEAIALGQWIVDTLGDAKGDQP